MVTKEKHKKTRILANKKPNYHEFFKEHIRVNSIKIRVDSC